MWCTTVLLLALLLPLLRFECAFALGVKVACQGQLSWLGETMDLLVINAEDTLFRLHVALHVNSSCMPKQKRQVVEVVARTG